MKDNFKRITIIPNNEEKEKEVLNLYNQLKEKCKNEGLQVTALSCSIYIEALKEYLD